MIKSETKTKCEEIVSILAHIAALDEALLVENRELKCRVRMLEAKIAEMESDEDDEEEDDDVEIGVGTDQNLFRLILSLLADDDHEEKK